MASLPEHGKGVSLIRVPECLSPSVSISVTSSSSISLLTPPFESYSRDNSGQTAVECLISPTHSSYNQHCRIIVVNKPRADATVEPRHLLSPDIRAVSRWLEFAVVRPPSRLALREDEHAHAFRRLAVLTPRRPVSYGDCRVS